MSNTTNSASTAQAGPDVAALLDEIQKLAHEVAATSRGIWALLENSVEIAEYATSSTLLCMIESHADSIANSADQAGCLHV